MQREISLKDILLEIKNINSNMITKEDAKEFATKEDVKEIREEKELTKRKLASALHVSDSIYARWENAKDTMPTRRIYQLANYYQINADYLLGLSNKKLLWYLVIL